MFEMLISEVMVTIQSNNVIIHKLAHTHTLEHANTISSQSVDDNTDFLKPTTPSLISLYLYLDCHKM
jgi:hypothetical protein